MPMKAPPHPGRGLKDDFDALGLSTADAATAIGISRSQLHRIMSGDSAITPELALRLETVIGSTAESWLGRQTAYDMAKVRLRAGEITKGLKRLTPPDSARPA